MNILSLSICGEPTKRQIWNVAGVVYKSKEMRHCFNCRPMSYMRCFWAEQVHFAIVIKFENMVNSQRMQFDRALRQVYSQFVAHICLCVIAGGNNVSIIDLHLGSIAQR